jgi:hypothetical protein
VSGSLNRILDELNSIGTVPAPSVQALDRQVATIARIFSLLRELSQETVAQVLTEKSGAGRILQYFEAHVGEPIPRSHLEVVAGISEFPRRIREWRVEFGWPIEEGAGSYTLKNSVADEKSADQWRTLNSVRRSKASARDKILTLFLRFPLGTVVTTEDLRYVTLGKDMRRVRELRTEFGWKILTRNTGRPDLGSGEYVLVDKAQQPEHDRHIDDEVLVRVLKRDSQRCKKEGCAWSPLERVSGDPRQYLEVHHIHWHVDRGANLAANLVTLCNVHHRVVHSKRLKGEAFTDWLTHSS